MSNNSKNKNEYIYSSGHDRENIFNIDFSILDRIPRNLADFKTTHMFMQNFCNELREKDFSQEYFTSVVESLLLWMDRARVARDSRIEEIRAGKKPTLRTARVVVAADSECRPSHPEEMARDIDLLLALGEACFKAILSVPALIDERTAELTDAVNELRARVKELEAAILSRPAPEAAARPRRKARPGEEQEEQEQERPREVGGEKGFFAYRSDALAKYIPDEADRMEFVRTVHAAETVKEAVEFTDTFADGKRLKRESLLDPDFQRRFYHTLHDDCKNNSPSNVTNKLNALGNKK